MSADLRRQFAQQCERARDVSIPGFEAGYRPMAPKAPVSVVLRKYPGQRAVVSVIGSSISWGSVDVWVSRGMRYRILRVYKNGQEVPRPHRVGSLP